MEALPMDDDDDDDWYVQQAGGRRCCRKFPALTWPTRYLLVTYLST